METVSTAARSRLPDPADLPRPWLRGYPPGVPPTYDYPEVPLTRLLDDAARDYPDGVATWFAGARLTYARLRDLVDRCAAVLADLGVARGSPIAVMLSSTPAAPVTVLAALRLGAVVVPVPTTAAGQPLRRTLREGRCAVAVVDATALPRLNEVRAGLPALRHVVASGIEEWLPFPRDRLFRLTGRRRGLYHRITAEDDARRLRDLLSAADPVAVEAVPRPADVAVHLPGPGVRLSHRQLLAAAFQVRLWIPDVQAGRERVLVAEAIADVRVLVHGLLAPVLAAARLVLALGPAMAADALAAQRPTLVAASPEVLHALAEGGDGDLASVRVGLATGPLDPALVDVLEHRSAARIRGSFGVPWGPFTHANPVYGRTLRGDLGLPVTDTVAVVAGEGGGVAPPGQEGRLLVHGPQVAAGGSWLDTGVRATMDERGSFAGAGREEGR